MLYKTDSVEVRKNGITLHGASQGEAHKVAMEMRQMIENFLCKRSILVSFIARSLDGKHIVKILMEP